MLNKGVHIEAQTIFIKFTEVEVWVLFLLN